MRATTVPFVLFPACALLLVQNSHGDVRSSLQNVPELHYSVQQTWYGTPRTPAYNFSINHETNGEVPISLDAPFYNEPEAPRSTRMGGFLGLLNFEAFEMQFIGDDNQCLHVIVGPAGHYIIFLMLNERLSIKDDLRMAYDSKVSYSPPYWKATIKIPLEYFPKNVKLFNAAARHGVGERRSMDVLYVDDQPLPSYFSTPPFRTAKPINFEKVLLRFDNSKTSSVWTKAIEEHRNAPRDSARVNRSSLMPESVVGMFLLAYTLGYLAYLKFL